MGRSIEHLYPFTAVELASIHGIEADRLVMRVTARCNQRCPFCQAELCARDEDPPLASLSRAAERMAVALPGCQVVVTGGEPTLRADVPQLCRVLADNDGVRVVELQTNAVRIGRRPERFVWPQTDKLRFLVAVHGFEPDVYDACTGTKGMLADAVAGIRSLLASGHEVEINHVVSSLNVHCLSSSVERVAGLFPKPPSPALHFSVMGIPEHRDVTELHVRYDLLVDRLEAALDRADALGLRCTVAPSASHARIPPCSLTRSRRLSRLAVPSHEHECTSADAASWWAKPEACSRCRQRDVCPGLPRSYVGRFGPDVCQPAENEPES